MRAEKPDILPPNRVGYTSSSIGGSSSFPVSRRSLRAFARKGSNGKSPRGYALSGASSYTRNYLSWSIFAQVSALTALSN